jgi:VCBS repeat-containing protein
MATYKATSGNDHWTVPEFGDPSGTLIDGLGGTDTLSFDRLLRSRFNITLDAATGYIKVDSISGASSTFHLKLTNVEKLSFNSGRDILDLATLFGDKTPPALSGFSPVSGSQGVALNSSIVLTFNESVKTGSGSLELRDGNNKLVESFAAGNSHLSVSGSVVTITPSAALLPGTVYQLYVPAGALLDTSGNAYAGLTTYSFTTQANQPPVSQQASFTLDQNTGLSSTLPVATDPEGQQLSYQLVQAATHGTLSIAADGSFTYQPAANYAGADSFSYRVSDGSLMSVSSLVSLVINPVTTVLEGTAASEILAGNASADMLHGRGGNDTLIGGGGIDTAVYDGTAGKFTLTRSGTNWVLADTTGNEGTDTLESVERLQFSNRTVQLDTAAHDSYSQLPDSLWHFFIVAFNGAPGVTYMNQLAGAQANGASIPTIVDIFTSKSQFTDIYGTGLDSRTFATLLTDNVVKNSASAAAKDKAVSDIVGALDAGLGRGAVIYNIFGNLARVPVTDPTWGGTSQQFLKEIEVAKYFTDQLSLSTTDIPTLRAVLAHVDQSTDVSGPDQLIGIIGTALMDDGLFS